MPWLERKEQQNICLLVLIISAIAILEKLRLQGIAYFDHLMNVRREPLCQTFTNL